MTIKFSPQRDMASPTHRMNADEACSDGRRKTVSYNRVSIAVSTECLKIKIKTSTKIDFKRTQQGKVIPQQINFVGTNNIHITTNDQMITKTFL